MSENLTDYMAKIREEQERLAASRASITASAMHAAQQQTGKVLGLCDEFYSTMQQYGISPVRLSVYKERLNRTRYRLNIGKSHTSWVELTNYRGWQVSKNLWNTTDRLDVPQHVTIVALLTDYRTAQITNHDKDGRIFIVRDTLGTIDRLSPEALARGAMECIKNRSATW